MGFEYGFWSECARSKWCAGPKAEARDAHGECTGTENLDHSQLLEFFSLELFE